MRALLFDVFGTCVDWRTSIDWAATRWKLPDTFADAWRAQYQPQLETVRSGKRPWVNLDVLHRIGLDIVLKDLDVDLPEADRKTLVAAWHRLDPWPDVVEGLTRFKATHIIAPCSNGHVAQSVNLAKHARLPWDAILGAEIAHAYKPDPRVYLASVDALGLDVHEVCMVAAHNGDLIAAQALGLRTAFVARPTEHGPQQRTDLEPEGDYDIVARDFVDLADQVLGSRTGERAWSADTLRALQRVTDAALAYLPLDELLPQLLERIAEILHSDTAAFLLLDERGSDLVATAAKGIEEEVEQGVRIPLGRGFAGRIAAERRAITIPDVDHADILNPILRERGIRSLLGVPLTVDDDVIGVLHVGTLTPRRFGPVDTELLQLAADRAAIAIERARLFHQRGVVEVLQRSLVPEQLPRVPGLELAARYRPAVRRGGIGGDWYDAFVLPGGGIALVVGDVMGHGIGAAAMMAQMRTGLRAYALDGHPPAGVVERLNRLALTLGAHQMTTLAYAVLDLERETVTVVSAGHVPPVLHGPGGETRVLAIEGDLPLGISSATAYHEFELDVPAGGSLVLVTDGAIEARGESIDRGLERLCDLVARGEDLGAVCAAIADGAARGHPADDDVAVLAVRIETLPDALRTTWPANPDALAALRPLLRRWLRRWEAGEDEIYDITVAVTEAAANAVEHAYAPGMATFDVEAAHEQGVITVTVRDRGQWREPRGAHRGRGLSIMQTLMESVDVRQEDGGTEVVLRRSVGRRAV